MSVIHKNAGRLLPYLVYLVITGLCLNAILLAIFILGINISGWIIPDILRVVNVIPALIGACGLFGFVPDTFLSKKKKAAISYFVNSISFKDFILFWLSIAGIQLVFILIHTCTKTVNIVLHSIDIATTAASTVCLLATVTLLLGLFYSRK